MAVSKITEAIVLVGGFGTRLKAVVTELPKPLAPICNRPFIEYLLDNLIENGITRVVLAVGYKHELITDHFKKGYRGLDITYAIEDKPLGTGGAIVNSLNKALNSKVLILNGDVYCSFKLDDLDSSEDLMITALELEDVSRYGSLTIEGNQLIAFSEKQNTGKGYINAGIYIANKKVFSQYQQGDNFSFERDFMPNYLKNNEAIVTKITKDIFIDIGTPEDYKKAQELLSDK